MKEKDFKLFKQQHKRSKRESEIKHTSYFHKPHKDRQDQLDKKYLQSCKLWKVKREKARDTKNFMIHTNIIDSGQKSNLEDTNIMGGVQKPNLEDNEFDKYLYDNNWDDCESSYSDYEKWEDDLDRWEDELSIKKSYCYYRRYA